MGSTWLSGSAVSQPVARMARPAHDQRGQRDRPASTLANLTHAGPTGVHLPLHVAATSPDPSGHTVSEESRRTHTRSADTTRSVTRPASHAVSLVGHSRRPLRDRRGHAGHDSCLDCFIAAAAVRRRARSAPEHPARLLTFLQIQPRLTRAPGSGRALGRGLTAEGRRCSRKRQSRARAGRRVAPPYSPSTGLSAV